MKRVVLLSALFAAIVFGWSMSANAADTEKKGEPTVKPAERVVVMYFHRTKRCPTCRRMGSYTEEAVTKGFAAEIKKGTVEFHFVDFQDQSNAALTEAYGIGGPTLIVAKVAKGKVADFRNLEEIWSKKDDKNAFLQYVRDNVTAYRQSDEKP